MYIYIYRFKDKNKESIYILNKRIFNEKKKNVLLYLYQYANLAGGLMLSLYLRLRSKDELSHMHFPFCLLVSKWSNMMSIYLESFSVRFP